LSYVQMLDIVIVRVGMLNFIFYAIFQINGLVNFYLNNLNKVIRDKVAKPCYQGCLQLKTQLQLVVFPIHAITVYKLILIFFKKVFTNTSKLYVT
jgi:hypothetical protein